MQNTTQEFKVGDKVKYKKGEHPRLNGHDFDKIYTISEILHNFLQIGNTIVKFEESDNGCYPTRLELAEQPQKHIHHDLIVAWVKDPKGCIIQWYDPHLIKWLSCTENKPSWSTELNYRIKPKTKEVTRWKWVVKTIDGAKYFVTDAEYTEDEAKKTFKHFTGIKIPDTAVTAIEEV